MINHYKITLPSYPRGFHLITHHIEQGLPDLPAEAVVQIFIQHTSASISVNENADDSVRDDMETFINYLVPERLALYTHTYEGDDDMPAHIKAALIGNHVSIPVINGHLALGTWQGIYLGEHRNHGGNRRLLVTVQS